jgi:hypothetical protein
VNRTALTADDRVMVVDWADCGPLFYGALTEDGERPVMRPESQAVVELVFDHGELYGLDMQFGTDFAAAEAMVARILAVGTVNLDRWIFRRNTYGSAAYVEAGDEAAWEAQEREDDRWAPQDFR